MGQYYRVCNLDKRQVLDPHAFGDGLKLLEFGCSSLGALTALTVLLADGNGRGGGDLHVNPEEHPIVGSWAGERIVIAGDYGNEGKFLNSEPQDALLAVAKDAYTEDYQQPEHVNLYHYAKYRFEDVSDQVLAALLEDTYIFQHYAEQVDAAARGEGYLFGSSRLPELVKAAQRKRDKVRRERNKHLKKAG